MNLFVLQDWMENLSLKQQTVVLSGFRGCDGMPKEDPSKQLARILRGSILKNAGTEKTSFLKLDLDNTVVDQFVADLDKYPNHYVIHLTHAAQIVGYYHPLEECREFWHDFYLRIVNAFHMVPETKEDNDFRLRDGVDSD